MFWLPCYLIGCKWLKDRSAIQTYPNMQFVRIHISRKVRQEKHGKNQYEIPYKFIYLT